jgi:Ca-activated chloride channel family protein
MTIDSPAFLVVGLLITAALCVAVVIFTRRRSAALAAAGAVPGSRRRGLQLGVWLSVAGIAVLSIGAAAPAASVPVPRTAGTVILAMDVSASMGAKDVSPTRLAAAQKAARAFIAAQPASVDIGVVAFEQGALTTARPDADHTLARAAVDRLKVAGGTSLGSAITASLSAITGKPVTLKKNGAAPAIGYWPSATIVMFSDGQDEGAGVNTDAAAAAALAQKAGVHVDTVGVGTAAGTSVKADGYSVHTALDQDALSAISKTTGGSYHPASDAAQLGGVASAIDLRLTVSNQKVPLAGAFIALALVLLGVGATLTVVRSGRLI